MEAKGAKFDFGKADDEDDDENLFSMITGFKQNKRQSCGQEKKSGGTGKLRKLRNLTSDE